ncbi:unnamed protein product [Closterium sp. Yama58-4]|nr:unnamed protein product [Closterium sp. Yama58-4]
MAKRIPMIKFPIRSRAPTPAAAQTSQKHTPSLQQFTSAPAQAPAGASSKPQTPASSHQSPAPTASTSSSSSQAAPVIESLAVPSFGEKGVSKTNPKKPGPLAASLQPRRRPMTDEEIDLVMSGGAVFL